MEFNWNLELGNWNLKNRPVLAKMQIKNNNPKTEPKNIYPLDERTFQFAKNVALFCKKLPRNISNAEYVKQVVKASGSVGANYIEANEALSKKDFKYRIKVCRKEVKESAYWLRLIKETNTEEFQKEATGLINEANELKKIFSAIIEKTK